MATKDLYGIGKGGAQIVDLRPINHMVQQRQAETIRRNEAKAKQRATAAAAINSQRDKLKSTAWSVDQPYIQGLIRETKNWMSDTYANYGEMSLVDNPELKREWEKRVAFINQQNETSHANLEMGNSMLEKRAKNLDDIDYNSAIEWDKYVSLPPEIRLSTPMPIIKDRELSLLEVMEEEGVQSAIEGTYIETGGTGIKDPETGRYTHYTGNKTDMDAYNSHIDKYSTNKEGRIFKYANRDAMKMIDTELYPTHIEENGEKIPNPEYQKELNRVRKQVVDDAASTWKKADQKKSKSSYGAVKEEKEDKSYGFRTGAGLNLSPFAIENQAGETTEGFTISDTKKPLVPIEVTTIIKGKEQVIKVTPSEIVRSKKGNWFLKGASSRDTWQELTEEEKAKWQEENPGEDPGSYDLDVTKSEDLNIPITSNIKAKLETQYGLVDLDKTLEDAKGYNKEGKQEPQGEAKKEDSSGLTGEDKLAYEWAVNNPEDKRAKAILTKLGK